MRLQQKSSFSLRLLDFLKNVLLCLSSLRPLSHKFYFPLCCILSSLLLPLPISIILTISADPSLLPPVFSHPFDLNFYRKKLLFPLWEVRRTFGDPICLPRTESSGAGNVLAYEMMALEGRKKKVWSCRICERRLQSKRVYRWVRAGAEAHEQDFQRCRLRLTVKKKNGTVYIFVLFCVCVRGCLKGSWGYLIETSKLHWFTQQRRRGLKRLKSAGEKWQREAGVKQSEAAGLAR